MSDAVSVTGYMPFGMEMSGRSARVGVRGLEWVIGLGIRSEEHTSELQSH